MDHEYEEENPVEQEEDYEGKVDLEDDEDYYKNQEDKDDLEEVYNGFFDDPEEKEEDKDEDVEYEYDAIVGGRDKKPVMNILNKGKLSKMEMDELFNQY